MAVRTAIYICAGCSEETDGTWPDPGQDEPGQEQVMQECPCGHRQSEPYPGYSFRTEAG
jgi:DNA-directed RNA polymerase subunit RPC12/RpoP